MLLCLLNECLYYSVASQLPLLVRLEYCSTSFLCTLVSKYIHVGRSVNISWFQLLKCEDLLLFFVIYNSK